MPLKIKTSFSDGTFDTRWWQNHLWRYNDLFEYTVDKKPLKVTIDPESRLVDLDFRNNTTK